MVGQGSAEHGADRGQTGVAGLGVIAPLLLDVVEEAGDIGRGDGVEVQCVGRDLEALVKFVESTRP